MVGFLKFSKMRRSAAMFLALTLLGLAIYFGSRNILIQSYLGEYYTGIEGRGCLLSIKNDRTFSVAHVYWIPTTLNKGQEFTGTYDIDGVFLQLTLHDASWSDVVCLVPRYVLVNWQGRKYLFEYDNDLYVEKSEWARDLFCERVNNDEELAEEITGTFPAFIDIHDKETLKSVTPIDDEPRIFGIQPFCSN